MSGAEALEAFRSEPDLWSSAAGQISALGLGALDDLI